MSKLADCLSTLSIISTSNFAENPAEQADVAVQHFLEGLDHQRAQAAIVDLQDAFSRMKIDSSAADAVRAILDQRKQQFSRYPLH